MIEPTANEAVREQLSAFLDGELPVAEMQLLLKRLERDTDLRRTFGRYVLGGEAMRATTADGPSRQFAARIAAAIETEKMPHAKPYSRPAMTWLKPVAGFGLAASVATVAVFAMRGQPTTPGVVSTTSSPLVAAAVTPNGNGEQRSYVVPMQVNAPAVSGIPAAQLTNYVVAHSEFSSPLGRRNVLTGILADEDLADSQAHEQARQNATQKKAGLIESIPAR
jgi:sigma-E factor negative regulatory protein RseA